jgi:hypothetical protein
MRYLISLMVSLGLLGIFLVNHWWATSQFAKVEQANAEELDKVVPPGAAPGDLGIRVSPKLMWAIEIDNLFCRFWFIVVPMILAINLGVAAMFQNGKSCRKAPLHRCRDS